MSSSTPNETPSVEETTNQTPVLRSFFSRLTLAAQKNMEKTEAVTWKAMRTSPPTAEPSSAAIDGIDTSGKTTAEILKAFVVAGKIPTHEQTFEDFCFGGYPDDEHRLQLLDVYRHVMVTTLNVDPATIQDWRSKSKGTLYLRMEAQLRAAVDQGLANPGDEKSLKSALEWLTFQCYFDFAKLKSTYTRKELAERGAES